MIRVIRAVSAVVRCLLKDRLFAQGPTDLDKWYRSGVDFYADKALQTAEFSGLLQTRHYPNPRPHKHDQDRLDLNPRISELAEMLKSLQI